MITKEKKYISPEEYLKFERQSEEKHEYFNGEVFAMSGASINHNIISGNIYADLHGMLKGTRYIPFGSDMRVSITENGLYTYPDVSVFSREIKLLDEEEDTALYPKVIFEVLSKATQGYDRGGKFKLYRDIPTLQEYVLVSQDSINIEHYKKQTDGKWLLEEVKKIEDTVVLSSIDCKLDLKDIYDRVKILTI